MSAAQRQAYRIAEANAVKMPYLVITALFLAVAALIYFAHVPEIPEEGSEDERDVEEKGLRGLWPHRHWVKGVVAQFFYVGAQVGVASFIIRFAQYTMPDLPAKLAANYLKAHLLGFMIGRFTGSGLMKVVPPAWLLSLFAVCSLMCLSVVLLVGGRAPIWAIILIGFFHSIMFPTIFALSVKHLGAYTKLGSSFLVMSIIGGAIAPALMGYISDISTIRYAFLVPLVCHMYVLYFALRGYRPQPMIEKLQSSGAVPVA